MTTYRHTPIAIAVHADTDSPIFGDSSIHVSVDDEATGPFIVLRHVGDDPKPGEVAMEIEQLEMIVRVARELMEAQPTEQEPWTREEKTVER